MALKKRKKKTSTKKQKAPRKNWLKDERVKIAIGFLCLGFALLILISQFSYLFSWKDDQSFQWTSSWESTSDLAQNKGGKIGYHIADLTINRWFGIASFTLPFLVMLVGLRILRIRLLPLRKTFLITIVTTIICSVWFSFLTLQSKPMLGSGLGGRHGYFIALNLRNLLGFAGTFILLLAISLSFILATSALAYKWFTNKVLKKGGSDTEKETKTETISPPEQETHIKPEIQDDTVFETEFATGNEDEVVQPHQNHSEPAVETDNFVVEPKSFEAPFEAEELKPKEIAPVKEDDVELSVENKGQTEEELKTSGQLEMEDYDPTLDLAHFELPKIDFLENYSSGESTVTNEELIGNKVKIEETLKQFKISITKIKATIGPTVTLYEIVPAPGVRISKIKNLEDDIALSLSALGIRIIAPIPGKGTIGIEVPNQNPEVVPMRSVVSSKKFQESKHELAVAMGKTISNETFVFDLAKMPHLLVAGATGQGKSVGLNVIIASLLYRKHPSQLKFVMVDPKKVELTLYSRIEKHYLAQLPDADEAIVTDTQKVIHTLNSLCIEMDERYDLLKKAQVRNLKEYNQKFIKRRLNPEKGHRYMPYIVVIIDEFADLIMTAGREVETPLARLAQLARAIGIHLVIATQRPTTNIITGMIKANFPARIAFRVTSMMDSRTILDSPGANQLIGRGDMLFSGGSDIVRLQCAFVDIPEIEKITDHIGEQQAYPTPFYLPEYTSDTPGGDSTESVDIVKRDAMFNDAARLVVAHQQGSTSLIQRKFSIGYNRAGRIMDQLETLGIVGPYEGSKARQVLFPDESSLEQYLNSLEN